MLSKSAVFISMIIIIEFMEANYPQSDKKNPLLPVDHLYSLSTVSSEMHVKSRDCKGMRAPCKGDTEAAGESGIKEGLYCYLQ